MRNDRNSTRGERESDYISSRCDDVVGSGPLNLYGRDTVTYQMKICTA